MKRITLTEARRRLATLWFTAAAVLFVLFIGLTVGGPLKGEPQEAWGWFLPSCVPTLSLVIGVLVAESRQAGRKERRVDVFLFKIATGCSAFYLVVVLATLLYLGFGAADKGLDFLKSSNLWLAPLQGLAAAALGAFFVSTDQGESVGKG